MASKSGKGVNFILGILIGILFVCIGVEGIADIGSNALYRAIDNEVANIIMGIVIMLAGLMLLVQTCGVGKLPKMYTTIAQIVILVIWILVIVFADFVYGMKHTNGSEWIVWIENFIYHLMILSCVVSVCSSAIKGVAGKVK